MTAPLTTQKRTRHQRYGHGWEGVASEGIDWPLLAIWVGGVVLAVAFWLAMGVVIVGLV